MLEKLKHGIVPFRFVFWKQMKNHHLSLRRFDSSEYVILYLPVSDCLGGH